MKPVYEYTTYFYIAISHIYLKDYALPSVSFPNTQQQEIAQFFSSMDWSAHAEALASTLVVPINCSKINYPILQGVEEAPDASRRGKVVTSNASTSQRQRNTKSFSKSSVGTSPFSSLDDYVADTLGSRGGFRGSIRAWSLDDSQPNASRPCYITYHMKDNRFCERIGRQHKSNNIMWTVDLDRMMCYQICHDPECRAMGFRGELVELPCGVQEQIREVLFDYELAALDEQAILDKARRGNACANGNGGTDRAEDADNGNDDTGVDVDEDFEKALLALDISGKKNAKGESYRNGSACRLPGGQISEPTCNTRSASTSVEVPKFPGNQDEFDTALSQALLTNPGLFP